MLDYFMLIAHMLVVIKLIVVILNVVALNRIVEIIDKLKLTGQIWKRPFFNAALCDNY
jgi:hypothetical protein